MKNQYIADVGDYGKYGLIRFLQGQEIRIGVNWYFTPQDNRKDGRHLEYLDRPAYRSYNSALYDEMKRLANLPGKDIHLVENCGLFGDCAFYHTLLNTDSLDASLRTAARRKWHADALQALKETSLIFADPDSGLGINQKASIKDSQRFILPNEVADYYNQGQDVYYYQHRDHNEKDVWKKRTSHMKTVLPGACLLGVAAQRWQRRVYIFVVHPEREYFYRQILDKFLFTAWGTLKVERKLFFTDEVV